VTRVEPGFDGGVLTLKVSLPRREYGETAKVSRFYEELEARLKRLPGVSEVAAANHIPLNGAIATVDYKVADRSMWAQPGDVELLNRSGATSRR
jgi:hypothetical protein